MTPERWQHIKHLVNSALHEEAETRTTLLQQSCADDFALRLGAEALLSATRPLPDAPLAPDQWQRIEKLFQSALELEPAQRAAFLAEACGGDEVLRHEVESLLVYQAAAGGLIQGAVHEAAGLLPNDEKARFTPGTTLNKRYRILGQLGKGGMGEVYRADDLKLGQPVALKFLTAKLSQDKAMLARFHSEVAMAHRVTHPNVCRVHDIGEVTTSAGNLHFLSMEYVDGEDLSSLLRRIGRLPSDKAVEIANQLCAGLAAAHDAGVLHRDLKPANVMIDGKGRVRITDFGLAGFAEQIKGSEVFAGTPAYMSPEQFAGKEVTTKSDIYALGLVLYEIFTGKRVFEAGSLEELKRMHESSAPTTPSSWVKDIDPLVERVILRCLEKDPAKRLASAKQVADALPGGDPLAAALAMGETPSPEMVAAAGSKTGMKPIYAVACLLAIIVGLIATAFLNRRTTLIQRAPLKHSPEVLASKAREVTAQLGWAEPPFDTAYGVSYNWSFYNYMDKEFKAADRWPLLESGQHSIMRFWYRESLDYLIPKRARYSGAVNVVDPPNNEPGMKILELDSWGYLRNFQAVPPDFEEAPQGESSAKLATPDWKGVFSLAGLDLSQFTAAESTWTPRQVYDARAAWTGTSKGQFPLPLRIEAAAYRGRIVDFRYLGPWEKSKQLASLLTVGLVLGSVIMLSMLVGVFVGVGWLAYRNLRHRKGDRFGAIRLAIFVALAELISWSFQVRHVPTGAEFEMLLQTVKTALFWGGFVGLLYLAIEPYVRRRWPSTIISWQRLLSGQWRDPLVGQNVLIGVLFSIFMHLLLGLHDLKLGTISDRSLPDSILGGRQIFGGLIGEFAFSLYSSLGFFFLLFLLRVFIKRDWLAAVMATFLFCTPLLLLRPSVAETLVYFVFYGGLFCLAIRYGSLCFVIAFFDPGYSLLTMNTSAWYFDSSMVIAIMILAVAGYAFHTSLGGQKVFSGKLLED